MEIMVVTSERRRRTRVLGAAAALIFNFFVTQSSEALPMEKNLTVYTGEQQLAPYDFKISTSVLGIVNPVLFGFLLHANELQELSPGIVKSWTFDFESNAYLLELDSVKFHNGRELTSEDVEFSIVRGFISKAENYNRVHFSDIAGIEALMPGTTFRAGLVKGIQTLGPKKIKITLKNKNPLFLMAFTMPFAPIVPREELKEDYYTWKTHPIGAGSYRIKRDFQNDELVLQRFVSDRNLPDQITYHTKFRPQVVYDLLLNQATNAATEVPTSKFISKFPAMISTLFFYRGKDQNENVNFRKAIYHGINRDALIFDDETMKPANEMMVRPYPGRVNTSNPFNPKLAAEYAAKIPKELLKKPLRIGFYTAEKKVTPLIQKRFDSLREQLAKLGITAEFGLNPEKFPTPEVLSKFDVRMSAKVVDLGDPAISYGAMAAISPYAAEVPDSQGKFDQLYQAAVQANSFDERMKSIERISALIHDEALMVPLMQRYVLYRFNPATILSLGEQPKPMFLNLEKVVLNKVGLTAVGEVISQKQ